MDEPPPSPSSPPLNEPMEAMEASASCPQLRAVADAAARSPPVDASLSPTAAAKRDAQLALNKLDRFAFNISRWTGGIIGLK